MKRVSISMVIAMVFLGSSGAFAQTALEEGQRLIRDGQFDEALRLLLPEYAASPTAQLAFTIARAYDAGSDVSQALRFYDRSLRIKGRKGRLVSADRRLIRRRIRALKKQAQRAPPTESATLSVSSNANRALVVLDGKPIGMTPLSGVLIAPGKHDIRVQQEGYGEWVSRFSIGVGQSLLLKAQLPEISAGVLVQTIPPGATAFVDGVAPCVTPCLLEIGAGNFQLKITRPGYNTVLHPLHRKTGAYAKLPVIRLPKEGGDAQITLLYDQAGAVVLVDGRVVGQTPLAKSIPVQAGRREVAVQRTGYVPWQTTVEIATGQALALQVELQPLYGATPAESSNASTTPPVGVEDAASGGAYRTWAWWSIGVGSALVLGGGAGIGLALYNRQQVTGAARMKIQDPKYAQQLYVLGITQADAVFLADVGYYEWIAGISAAGVGLAGVVTGLVLYFLDTDPESAVSQSLSVEPMIWPGGGSGVATTLRF